MENQIQIGVRVEVQFGKQKLYAALVHSIVTTPPSDYVPKELLSVIDELSIVTPDQLKFWEWMSTYYMCTLGEIMQAALPAYFKLDSETYFVRNPESELDILELSDDEYLIAEALNHQEEITFKDITLILSKSSVSKPVKSLLQKRVIYIKETLHERYTPKVETFVQLHNRFKDGTNKLNEAFSVVEKFPKQELLLLAFIELSKQNKPVKKSELLKRAGVSASALESLIKKDILELTHQIVDRIAENDTMAQEIVGLSEIQQTALTSINDQFTAKDVVLLHGITSSGKTMLYLDLIQQEIEKGKQVLYLIPEISLTVQLIQRIEKVLGNVAVYHSRFSNAERVEIWNKLLTGQTKVVLGARSSVFLPFQNLGLVIIDEEHDTSYKQFDPAPRYQCRDAAIYLAKQFNAKVVLGSATPSVESYSNAKNGKYGLVELQQRFGEIQLPEIEFISMTDARKKKEVVSGISFFLRDEIQLALDNKEQVILFQNRRGYAPYLACGNCNWIPMCAHCDVSMTYHKFTNDLRCHYCGYTQQNINTCSACGSHEMEQRGLGTERIEEELKLLYPNVSIGRMDYDTTRTKKGHEKIIEKFESGEYDILVGTQMVTKGLDFANVRLVGVLNADALLYYPDFRAMERAYQLLMQVSGRAGRRDKRGKVLIQIGNTEHSITELVRQNDYTSFYKSQLQERQQFHYPPYSRLIQLTVKHKDIKVTIDAASRIAYYLNTTYNGWVVGPNAPVIQRINNYYLRDILIKIPRATKELQKVKNDIQQSINALYQFQSFKQVRVVTDVDCY